LIGVIALFFTKGIPTRQPGAPAIVDAPPVERST
jgi:hypothetical protein